LKPAAHLSHESLAACFQIAVSNQIDSSGSDLDSAEL
jgi:hypothetical protein